LFFLKKEREIDKQFIEGKRWKVALKMESPKYFRNNIKKRFPDLGQLSIFYPL
jgi:hypothetical protein